MDAFSLLISTDIKTKLVSNEMQACSIKPCVLFRRH